MGIKQKFTKIKLIVYDFDGVMTDNTVIVDQNGVEAVRVSRADSYAIGLFKERGIPQLILSTEPNKIVSVRAKKLGIPVIQDCRYKEQALVKYCKRKKIGLKNVLYVGNDMNDMKAMMRVGIKVCPFDAHPAIKRISDIVTKTKGGNGVIRELADIFGAAESVEK